MVGWHTPSHYILLRFPFPASFSISVQHPSLILSNTICQQFSHPFTGKGANLLELFNLPPLQIVYIEPGCLIRNHLLALDRLIKIHNHPLSILSVLALSFIVSPPCLRALRRHPRKLSSVLHKRPFSPPSGTIFEPNVIYPLPWERQNLPTNKTRHPHYLHGQHLLRFPSS